MERLNFLTDFTLSYKIMNRLMHLRPIKNRSHACQGVFSTSMPPKRIVVKLLEQDGMEGRVNRDENALFITHQVVLDSVMWMTIWLISN